MLAFYSRNARGCNTRFFRHKALALKKAKQPMPTISVLQGRIPHRSNDTRFRTWLKKIWEALLAHWRMRLSMEDGKKTRDFHSDNKAQFGTLNLVLSASLHCDMLEKLHCIAIRARVMLINIVLSNNRDWLLRAFLQVTLVSCSSTEWIWSVSWLHDSMMHLPPV